MTSNRIILSPLLFVIVGTIGEEIKHFFHILQPQRLKLKSTLRLWKIGPEVREI